MVYLCLCVQSCSRKDCQRLHRLWTLRSSMASWPTSLLWSWVSHPPPAMPPRCMFSHSNWIVSLCYLKPPCGSCGLQDRVRKAQHSGPPQTWRLPIPPTSPSKVPQAVPSRHPCCPRLLPISRLRSRWPVFLLPLASASPPPFLVHTLEALARSRRCSTPLFCVLVVAPLQALMGLPCHRWFAAGRLNWDP